MVITVVLGALAFLSNKIEADKSVFGSGEQDEIEKAKKISLEVLRDKAAKRAIGKPDEFKVKKVSIDELKMAHAHVQQTIENVPVWEGEAIVHLNADGTTADITDDLKDSIAVNTQANFSEKDAVKMAKQFYKDSKHLSEEPIADL